jgi:hypothetical protein
MKPGALEEMAALADRVEALGDITCPLCGEEGFDIPGYLYTHRNGRNCDVEAACHFVMANRNSEIAAALRARAQSHLSGKVEK